MPEKDSARKGQTENYEKMKYEIAKSKEGVEGLEAKRSAKETEGN